LTPKKFNFNVLGGGDKIGCQFFFGGGRKYRVTPSVDTNTNDVSGHVFMGWLIMLLCVLSCQQWVESVSESALDSNR